MTDTDGDGWADDVDNCPAIANPGQEDADGDAIGDTCDGGDADGDGYIDSAEVMSIGTEAATPCGANWPSNLINDGPSWNKLDIQDLTSFIGPLRRLDTGPLDASFSARWDLSPGPNDPFENHINIVDLTTLLNGTALSPAYPPMFGGLKAWGRDCPFAP